MLTQRTYLPEDIPFDRIRQILPEDWYIESAARVPTVSGWDNLGETKGVCLAISRPPYENELHRTKAGGLAVDIPKVYVYIFPTEFEGKHVNTSAIFHRGQITKPDAVPIACHAVLIMEKFVKVDDAYIFHNDPSFPDWKDPIAEIVTVMMKGPSASMTPD